MARTDDLRWSDWRGNRRRPFRLERSCTGCEIKFRPLVDRQRQCLRCIGEELGRVRAARMVEEQSETNASLAKAGVEDLLRQIDRRREADAAFAKRLSPQYGALRGGRAIKQSAKGGKAPSGMSKRRRNPGGRSSSKQWAHVAEKKLRENWSARKIAKFLGRPLGEVRKLIEEVNARGRV